MVVRSRQCRRHVTGIIWPDFSGDCIFCHLRPQSGAFSSSFSTISGSLSDMIPSSFWLVSAIFPIHCMKQRASTVRVAGNCSGHITFPLFPHHLFLVRNLHYRHIQSVYTHLRFAHAGSTRHNGYGQCVLFFVTFFRGARFGFSTSMAIVLFVIILVLYLIQNRIAQRSVFYG